MQYCTEDMDSDVVRREEIQETIDVVGIWKVPPVIRSQVKLSTRGSKASCP